MILTATIDDAEQIAALVNSAYRGDASKRGWTTEADLLEGTRTEKALVEELIGREDTTVLKYVADDQIVGCVELRRSAGDMYLGMLTVLPTVQGEGIGKLLLNAAEEEAQKHHCSRMIMTVISVRSELIDWYLRKGYVDTGVRKPFDFEDTRFGIPKQQLEFVVLEKAF